MEGCVFLPHRVTASWAVNHFLFHPIDELFWGHHYIWVTYHNIRFLPPSSFLLQWIPWATPWVFILPLQQNPSQSSAGHHILNPKPTDLLVSKNRYIEGMPWMITVTVYSVLTPFLPNVCNASPIGHVRWVLLIVFAVGASKSIATTACKPVIAAFKGGAKTEIILPPIPLNC